MTVRAAHADDTRLDITNTLITEYRGDNKNDILDDDNYGAVVNRLNMTLSSGKFSGQVRVDTFYFFDPTVWPPSDNPDESNDAGPDGESNLFEDNLVLERINVRYKTKHWTVTAGDYFRQLGQGIVLSIRKVDEAGVDLAIRGGELEYRNKTNKISVFAGVVNPANLDNLTQREVTETNDALLGMSYDFKRLRWLKYGFYGLYSAPTEEVQQLNGTVVRARSSINAGNYIEFPELFDVFTLYAELDVQSRETVTTVEDGLAAYGTADLVLGNFTFLGEFLYLREFEQLGSENTALESPFRYNQPPTLERIDQDIANLRDVLGGRFRAEYYLETENQNTTFFYTISRRINDPRANDGEFPEQVRTMHNIAGTITNFQEGRSRLNLSAGYREELQGGRDFKTLINAEVDYLQWVSGPASIHLQIFHESRTIVDPVTNQQDPFNRGNTLLSLEWNGLGSLTGEFGYDTLDNSGNARQFFGAAIIVWDIVPQHIQTRLTAGTRRGGLRCVAGICRNFPPFAGVQNTLILRY